MQEKIPNLCFFLFALLYDLNVLDFNCRTCQFHTVFGRVIAQWHSLVVKKPTWPLELACLIDAQFLCLDNRGNSSVYTK